MSASSPTSSAADKRAAAAGEQEQQPKAKLPRRVLFDRAWRKCLANADTVEKELAHIMKSSGVDRSLVADVMSRWRREVTAEFEQILEQEEVKPKLDLLDSLVNESVSSRGQLAWRPPGIAELHMRPVTVKCLTEYADVLTTERRQVHSRVNKLEQDIKALDNQLNENIGKLDTPTDEVQ